jgi:ribosome modulation factor
MPEPLAADKTTPLHNSVSNDAIVRAHREYALARRAQDEATAQTRLCLKRIKAEGIDTKQVIASYQSHKLDPEEAARQEADRARHMELRGIPVLQTFRTHLFDDWDATVTEKTQAEFSIWEVSDQGYKAGRDGVKIEDCPYPPGSEFHAEWCRFWKQGQEAIAREMGPTGKMASTAKQRPGRQTRIPGTEPRMRAPEADATTTAIATLPAPARKAKRKAGKGKGRGATAGRKRGNGAGPRTAEDGVAVY